MASSPEVSIEPSAAPSVSLVPSAGPSTAVIPDNPSKVVKGKTYRPDIDPGAFSSVISNSYMPLVPGTIFRYEGGGERTETVVTERTHEVMGVPAVVVRDRVFEGSTLVEDTEDWYAQDAAGNVWYFGENTAECQGGRIASRHGAWEAGVDGAQPGVVMLADPQVGEYYRQEFLKGQAEDVARVLSLGRTMRNQGTTYRDVVVTEEFTALEPAVLEHKLYAPSVGLIQERTIKGGSGIVHLIDVRTTARSEQWATRPLCHT